MKQKILTFCIILFISNCADKTTQIDETLNPLESRSLFGIDLSLSPDDDTFPRWDHDRILQRISEMKIKWVREAFIQYGIEYPQGVYHWEKYDEVIRRWQKYNFHIFNAFKPILKTFAQKFFVF